MFTGIIEKTSSILNVTPSKSGVTIRIYNVFSDVVLGESIAVDGACLTVTGFKENEMSFDLSPETLKLTKAQEYQQGSLINLERALRYSDRLGGHFVTGHVDQVGMIQSIQTIHEFIEVTIGGVLPSLQNYLIKKGSVSVNGVSLTINEVTDSGFSVCLIPHTLSLTNLSQLKTGDKVNLEMDWMVKTIQESVKRILKETHG